MPPPTKPSLVCGCAWAISSSSAMSTEHQLAQLFEGCAGWRQLAWKESTSGLRSAIWPAGTESSMAQEAQRLSAEGYEVWVRTTTLSDRPPEGKRGGDELALELP